MDPTVGFICVIAVIVLLIVVCFYENSKADLTQNLRRADDTIKDWIYSYQVLKSSNRSLHCRTCTDPTTSHNKISRGECGYHCCDNDFRELCSCVATPDPRGEPGAGCLTVSKRSR